MDWFFCSYAHSLFFGLVINFVVANTGDDFKDASNFGNWTSTFWSFFQVLVDIDNHSHLV